MTNIRSNGADRSALTQEDANIGSLRNESTIDFKNRYTFTSNGRYEAVLWNESILFLQDDSEAKTTLFHSSIPYPDGCRATYLHPASNNVLFVAFELCSPLRIVLTNTNNLFSLSHDQPYVHLSGRKIIVANGYDISEETIQYYIFLTEDEEINLMPFTDDTPILLPATRINSCSSLTNIHPLGSESFDDRAVSFLVDCETSAGNRRYGIRYDAYDNIVQTVATSTQIDPKGTPVASENGRFLAVIASDDTSHYIILYSLQDSQIPPVRINSISPIGAEFTISGNSTWMALHTTGEGENDELIDVSQYLSTHSEGRFELDGTSTESYVTSVSEEGFVVVNVWNSDTLQFDFLMYTLSDNTATVRQKITAISSQLATLAFVRFDSLPIATMPQPTPASSIILPHTSSEVSAQPSPSGTPASIPERDRPNASVVLIVVGVLGVLGILIVVILIVVILRTKCCKSSSDVENTKSIQPDSSSNSSGELVTAPITYTSLHVTSLESQPQYHAQVSDQSNDSSVDHTTILVTAPSLSDISRTISQQPHRQETDEGYATSASSRTQSYRSTPVGERRPSECINPTLLNEGLSMV